LRDIFRGLAQCERGRDIFPTEGWVRRADFRRQRAVQLIVIDANEVAAKAQVAAAEASLLSSKFALNDTELWSPIDGIVANRKARVGEYVTAGTRVLSVVPVNNLTLIGILRIPGEASAWNKDPVFGVIGIQSGIPSGPGGALAETATLAAQGTSWRGLSVNGLLSPVEVFGFRRHTARGHSGLDCRIRGLAKKRLPPERVAKLHVPPRAQIKRSVVSQSPTRGSG
jgi:HlyD family secretion protein